MYVLSVYMEALNLCKQGIVFSVFPYGEINNASEFELAGVDQTGVHIVQSSRVFAL